MTEPRRNFNFVRLYAVVLESLSTPDKKKDFFRAICAYGFDKIQPEFNNDDELLKAWGNVSPELDFSWKQQEQGSRGGAVTQTRNKQTKSVTSIKQTAPRPIPPISEPTSQFIEDLKAANLQILLAPGKSLNYEQWIWLKDEFGDNVADYLLEEISYWIKKTGVDEFWEKRSDKTVFEIARKRGQDAAEAYSIWLSESFPNVANMQHSLTFKGYSQLRKTYGRSNILVKLDQLNNKKPIYKNASAYEVIEEFIKKSITQGASHRFGLSPFDDSPQSAKVPKIGIGFDKAFDMLSSRSFVLRNSI